MMNRREFTRACALIVAGVIAADQLEILDRLAPRRLFPVGEALPTGLEWEVPPELQWALGEGYELKNGLLTQNRLSTKRRTNPSPVVGKYSMFDVIA